MTDEYEKSKENTKRYKKIKKLLKAIYGYDNFKPKQYEIINNIISGNDVCAVLPTGYGKSLTFQIPALYLDQPAIVISPLISLMDDQRMILDELGISSCCYNSNVKNKIDMRRDIKQSKYKFIYITPESLISLQNFLVDLFESNGISLIAIDEAHCISSYGNDFRPKYREITFLKDILPDVPILAVTATATETVAEDICDVLKLNNRNIIKSSFNRENLYLEVRKKSVKISRDIAHGPGVDLIPILLKHKKEPTIIYCLTKSETVKVAEILKAHKIKCGVYSGDVAMDDRKEIHELFLANQIQVMVATIAYGMGINKSDVRVVIHYGAPKNIEGYYQEIGRAGRDGEKGYCYVLYGGQDFKLQEGFISNVTDPSYRRTLTDMLIKMKTYLQTNRCRKKVILEYFDEDLEEECGFCDNCCGVKQTTLETTHKTISQNVNTEAKQLIDVIESIKGRSFGISMYIDILRGSNNKKITKDMKKSKLFSAGKKKSADWWKELTTKLIELGYLQSVVVKAGRFTYSVIKVTKKGLSWSSLAGYTGLSDVFEDMESNMLPKISMVNVT